MTEVEPVIIKASPDPDDYQGEENRFMHAIGACVTRWAFIDRQLLKLLQWSLKTSSERAAFVHYNQPNLKGRLQFVDRLLKRTVPNDQLANEWRSICAAVTKLIATRNVIVHHPLRRTGKAKDGKVVYEYSIYVEPAQRWVKEHFDGFAGKDELLIEDLEAHAAAVDAAEERLREFRRCLSPRPDIEEKETAE